MKKNKIEIYKAFVGLSAFSSNGLSSYSSAAYSPIIPVKIYSNADLDKQILAENKGKSGIYR
jgi:hypothetical protein